MERIFTMLLCLPVFYSCLSIKGNGPWEFPKPNFTDISTLEISKIELRLWQEGITRSEAVPGRVYIFEPLLYDHKGRLVENPDPYKLNVVSPDNSFTEIQLANGFQLMAQVNPSTFHFLHSPCTLSIKVKDNLFPEQTFTWPIDWQHAAGLDYSGENGTSGSEGKSVYGGRGGRGGNIIIRFLSGCDVIDFCVLLAAGGKGGTPGSDGVDGASTGMDPASRQGLAGQNGADGNITTQLVKDPILLFRGVIHPQFKRINLLWKKP